MRYFVVNRCAFFCGLAVLFSALLADGAPRTLRIISYNLDCADTLSDANITNSFHSLPVVIQAVGLHHMGTNAQPADVITCEELLYRNSVQTSLSNLVFQLNATNGAGLYAYDPTFDTNTGGGPDGLIYNTHTIQVVSARVLKTGQTVLLQPNLTYTTAASPGGGSNGVTRAPMVYQLRPIGYGTTNDFYIYVSHARSSSDDSVGDARYAEAQEVRSDAKYMVPAGSHIMYAGDWNLFNGSNENAYKCLTGQVTSDGRDWGDNSSFWANTNATQGFDPTSKTYPPTTTIWTNGVGDNANYLYDDSTDGRFTSRLDIQLVNRLMVGAYNSQGGVEIAPDTSDPFDSSNFPSSQYHYAFEVFGNNGSMPFGGYVTNSANHSLDDLTNTVFSPSLVYRDILQDSGVATTATGSDHYPIVGDYLIATPTVAAPAEPVLSQLGFSTNKNFQFKLASTSNTVFSILASSNLTQWATVGSATTGTNGTVVFQDTNSALVNHRFYRAVWP